MKRKFGVRGALLLLALTPAALVSSGLIAYFAHTRIQDMEKSLIERGEAAVANLASASEFGVYSGNAALLDRLALSVLQHGGLARIAILDREGRVLAERGPGSGAGAERDLLWFEAPILHTLIAVGDPVQEIGDTPPAGAAGAQIGAVRVAVSRAPIERRQREVIRTGVAALLLCLSAVTGIGLLVGGRIYRPIRRLSAAFDALSEDRLDARVPERSPWELGRLERGFNLAAGAVQRSHRQLAERVQAATAELREALRALERKNAELEQAHREALRADEAKSRFLSSVSHEFRKPLHGVIAGTDLLLKTRPLDGRQREYTTTIHHSARLLLNLVNNILDWSRIEATDDLALSEKDFSPAELLEQTREIVAPEAQSKDVRLELSVDRAIPARVRGDPTRLGQVLLNLVGNAVKFTDRGAVAVAARVAPTRSDDAPDAAIRLRFDVTDTGIGIEPRALASIFEGFAQADATIGRNYGGTGLGLSITRRLVKRMNGEIGVKSAPDAGSHFWIEIPFSPAEDAPEDAPAETWPAIATSAARHTRSLRVLAADDSWINQRIMEAILTNGGHRPHLVADGEAALAALRGPNRFDLAILDLQMPKLWGHEVVERYREGLEKPAIPVILLTADVTAEGQSAARTEGISVALQKPIIEEELLDVIHRLIAGWPLRGWSALRSSPAKKADGEESRTLRPALLDRLRQLPSSVVPEVIANFVRNADRRVARIGEAAEAGDAAALREALHLLGGASDTLGGERVAAACEAIRRASARGDAATVRAGVAELPALVGRLIERLKAYPSP